MKNLKRKRYSAFTLVEILVVIAIVTVLAAILFPVFSSVREGGRRTACLNNLRQIGFSVRMYVSDSNGSYPFIFQPSGCQWVDAIYPYAKSETIFSCPDVKHGEYHTGCTPSTPLPEDDPTLVVYKGSYDLVTRQALVKVAQDGTKTTYQLSQQTGRSCATDFLPRRLW